MRAFAIAIKDNKTSELGYSRLVESSIKVDNKFDITWFDATTPNTCKETMLSTGLRWNYPWEGEVADFASGLTKKAYPTKNKEARISCALSHYRLWQQCIKLDEPILILEHDAYFVNKIDFNPAVVNFTVLGINNPLGATRRAKVYYDAILSSINPYQLVPYVDEDRKVPQGLAGNSAYILKPKGAAHLIATAKEFGLWPNDALMCAQLITGLGVSRKFYTNIQGLESTTSC
jgi:GR25 family glycosyltransferase involved in LPS biosynthesis